MNTKALINKSYVCSQHSCLHILMMLFLTRKVFGLSYVEFHNLIDLTGL